jgi:hypothetical protein
MAANRWRMSWSEDAFDPLKDEELVECGWDYMLDTPLIPPYRQLTFGPTTSQHRV